MKEERIFYVEEKIKELISELKSKNCLSENFTFCTEAERCEGIEAHVDIFLSQEY